MEGIIESSKAAAANPPLRRRRDSWLRISSSAAISGWSSAHAVDPLNPDPWESSGLNMEYLKHVPSSPMGTSKCEGSSRRVPSRILPLLPSRRQVIVWWVDGEEGRKFEEELG